MTILASRARTATAALATLLALTSCGTAASFPERDPDAVGSLVPLFDEPWPDDLPLAAEYRLVLDSVEFAYYTDAVITVNEDTVIADQTGTHLRLDALVPNIAVEIWVDACRESYPVQCDATHIRVTRID